jgi:acyl carrier protein
LGEIETVLGGEGGIREAAVELEEEGGEARLVAYVTLGAGERVEVRELRRRVRGKLPEHMVPSRYVVLAELPLLASGKVNRRGLKEMPGEVLADTGAVAGPVTEVERQLVEVWKELLKIEEVGTEQNFFEMGGHSLLVLQVMARIRRTFGVELPVRTLFEEPTIAGLAQAVEKAEAEGKKARMPVLERRPRAKAAASREALLAQLDQLSADDVQTLLKQVLEGKQAVPTQVQKL